MDLKRIGNLENLNPTTPQKTKISETGGPSFKEALDKLGQSGSKISEKAAKESTAPSLKFSNHAVERMRSRGVVFNPQDMQRLNEAVNRAAAKGSRDSLILMDDTALIVSVKNNTVVTVVDKNSLKENVFTNIDSTIVV